MPRRIQDSPKPAWVILVEVKAGSLHPSAQRGAREGLHRQLKDNVVGAAEQARRTREAFLSGSAQNLRDWDGRPLELDLGEISRSLDVVVTLEHLLGVDTALWQLVDARLLPAEARLPWVVKLHDLQIITSLIEYSPPSSYFLSRRAKLNVIRRVEATDELDWFMSYLFGGLYFDHMLVEDDPPDRIFLASMTDDLDAYLFQEHGLRDEPTAKPRQGMPPQFRRLIEFLDGRPMDGYMEASLALLELDGKKRRQIPNRVERMRRKSGRDGKLHDMTLVLRTDGKTGITV